MVTTIPVLDYYRPREFKEFKALRISRHWSCKGGKVFSSRYRPPSPPGNVPFTHFCRLTTGWTVRDRIPVGTRFSAVQTSHGAHPASCKIGTGSFLWVEATGAWG